MIQSHWSHCPCWITFIALSRQFAFKFCLGHIWAPKPHTLKKIGVSIPVLCFHLLVLMDVQAALCSSTVLSVNIHKALVYTLNQKNGTPVWFYVSFKAQREKITMRSANFWKCSKQKIGTWEGIMNCVLPVRILHLISLLSLCHNTSKQVVFMYLLKIFCVCFLLADNACDIIYF